MVENLREYKDGALYKGVVYKADDIVVAEGEVGYIETIDFDRETCMLGASVPLEEIENPEHVNIDAMCTMIGIRKATLSEALAYGDFMGVKINEFVNKCMN